jgi:hypothetical protein
LVQQENVFGMLMKKKELPRRFWKVFPNHEHYVRNCEMLHTCMFAKTMIFCQAMATVCIQILLPIINLG